jgi:hypothetical protein
MPNDCVRLICRNFYDFVLCVGPQNHALKCGGKEEEENIKNRPLISTTFHIMCRVVGGHGDSSRKRGWGEKVWPAVRCSPSLEINYLFLRQGRKMFANRSFFESSSSCVVHAFVFLLFSYLEEKFSFPPSNRRQKETPVVEAKLDVDTF